jgi:nucleotide-binding universal stress UspA family protein
MARRGTVEGGDMKVKKPARILVPTDFSGGSARALNEAISMAERGESEVILLHVIQEDGIQCSDTYCLDDEALNRIKNRTKQKAAETLEELTQTLAAARKVNLVPIVRIGIPHTEILDEQRTSGAELIVMSGRRNGSGSRTLGVTAEKVVLGANCAVYLIK